MKVLSILLAGYISFLSVHPIILEIKPIAAFLPAEETCTTSCCEEIPSNTIDKEASCQEADTCYPSGMCNSCSSCVCGLYCFCCVVQTACSPFTVSENSTRLNLSAGQHLVSNYHSDCFRPPEAV